MSKNLTVGARSPTADKQALIDLKDLIVATDGQDVETDETGTYRVEVTYGLKVRTRIA